MGEILRGSAHSRILEKELSLETIRLEGGWRPSRALLPLVLGVDLDLASG